MLHFMKRRIMWHKETSVIYASKQNYFIHSFRHCYTNNTHHFHSPPMQFAPRLHVIKLNSVNEQILILINFFKFTLFVLFFISITGYRLIVETGLKKMLLFSCNTEPLSCQNKLLETCLLTSCTKLILNAWSSLVLVCIKKIVAFLFLI